MKHFQTLFLILLTGCATKYIVPSNRFITAESQGGAFHGQFEIQKTNANQLTIDTSQNTVTNGVTYASINRTGFLLSNSMFERFDLIWSHVGGANSMVGGKFQFIGTSRTAKGAGHKFSFGALFGNNEHETEDESIEFDLGGQEFLFIYGYRFTENILTYSSFSLATYNFSGSVNAPSRPAINGTSPEYQTKIQSLSGGAEVSYEAVFAKLECTYQVLKTQRTSDHSNFATGFSIGYNW